MAYKHWTIFFLIYYLILYINLLVHYTYLLTYNQCSQPISFLKLISLKDSWNSYGRLDENQ